MSMTLPAKETSSDVSAANVDRSHRFHSLVFTATSLLRVAANLGESNARPPPSPPEETRDLLLSPPPPVAAEGAKVALMPEACSTAPPARALAEIMDGRLGGDDAAGSVRGIPLRPGFPGFPLAGSANRNRGSGMSICESEMSSSSKFVCGKTGRPVTTRGRVRRGRIGVGGDDGKQAKLSPSTITASSGRGLHPTRGIQGSSGRSGIQGISLAFSNYRFRSLAPPPPPPPPPT